MRLENLIQEILLIKNDKSLDKAFKLAENLCLQNKWKQVISIGIIKGQTGTISFRTRTAKSGIITLEPGEKGEKVIP